MNMFKVKNLEVSLEGKKIIKGLDLEISAGQVVFLMGPNGSGKSTLGNTIMGNPDYKVDRGSISFNSKSILKLSADRRAKLGIFLAFQSPMEFEGIKTLSFLKTALASQTGKKVNPFDFRDRAVSDMESLGMDSKFLSRDLNFGFSGGEKKKSEIIQLLTLKPKLAILDEIDSGLDVDGLKSVAESLLKLKKKKKTAFLVITHHSSIARYLQPDVVYILSDGKLVKKGDEKLIKEIEKNGYKNI